MVSMITTDYGNVVPEYRYKYRAYAKSQRMNMKDFLRKDGCVLCGFKHKPLEIHHHWGRPFLEENGMRRSYNSMGLMATAIELSKCVPLCVDCHLKVHRSDAWKRINKKYSVDEIYGARFGVESEV